MDDLPLGGLRVVELASVLAGPAAGMFLAELGADVVKVENPRTGGDVTRGWRLPGEPEGPPTSYFSCANWGKRSIAVDLSRPAGREVVERLVDAADVVLASGRPGSAARLGVDAAALRRDRPRLIVAEVTGYGVDDPRPGFDAVIQAESGFASLNGTPDTGPLKMPVALMDLLAAHQLKEAVLVALIQRERTGRGTHVSVSLLRSGLSALANQGAGWLWSDVAPAAMGSAHPSIVPYGEPLACADGGRVILAVGTDRQFQALGRALGDPRLAAEPRFARNVDRVRHRRELEERVRALVAGFETQDLLARLREAGVPAAPVRRVDEALASEGARPLLLGQGERRGLRSAAWDLGPRLRTELSEPPELSQHAEAILREELGLSLEEVASLDRIGAVFFPGPGRAEAARRRTRRERAP